MILYLVRHGESIYNAEGRIQGQSDIPLSPLGQRQSLAVATGFRGTQVDAIYASPLIRRWIRHVLWPPSWVSNCEPTSV